MNSIVLAAASGAAFDAGLFSVICLVLGIIFLILSVLFFFLFDIPKVFLLKTGKGARNTVKKMKEINAQTGRLRKNDDKYMLHTDVVTTDEMRKKPHPEMHKPFVAANSGTQGNTQPLADAPKDQTTLLGRTETTVLASNDTTVLSGNLADVGPQVSEYNYKRSTAGRFETTYKLMFVHAEETI
ncbi:MAG: hypothetical protein IJC50_09235 [Clostridia bacterium]|nr:hypothetical protein [Clostridia bacterium]